MSIINPAILTGRSAHRSLTTSFVRVSETTFAGHVFAPDDPAAKFVVEIACDGFVVQTVRADLPMADRTVISGGDGCHGFRVSLPVAALETGAVIVARIANIDVAVGEPIIIDRDHPLSADTAETPTGLRWLGGLRFSAWTAGTEPPSIEVAVDGEPAMQARAAGWQSIAGGDAARPARAFDFHLPERFADGAYHRLTVAAENGEVFSGCPLPFVAYNDGLAAAMTGFGGLEGERLRAEMFDQLHPMSWPFARYAEWRRRFPASVSPPCPDEFAVVVTGGDADDTVASLEPQTDVRWVAASLPATGNALEFAPDAMRGFINGAGAGCPFVVLAPAGTRFLPGALGRIAAAFAQSGKTHTIYGDLDVLNEDGTPWPLLFPAFDYERMLEQGYCALIFALRRSTLNEALDHGAADLFRLFNAQLDGGSAGAAGIVHLPGAIAALPRLELAAVSATLAGADAEHFRRRDMTAEAIAGNGGGALPQVRVRRRPAPGATVSIVIMSTGDDARLAACLAAIRPEAECHDAEIVVVTNRTGQVDAAATRTAADAAPPTTLVVDGPFSVARMANLAARSITRDYLCLMADEIVAAGPGWLAELLSRIAEPCVGAVGPLLLGTNGLIAEAGIVLGPNFAAAPALADTNPAAPGYAGRATVAHQQSALGAGCLLTWRGDYLAVGGMDEIRFPFEFGAIDFCLKLRAAGRRIVIAPEARLTRSPARRPSFGHAARFGRERDTLRARWGEVLAADPCYNPLLSLDPVPYSALAWPPRSDQPRRNEAPVPMSLPEGF